MTKLFFKKQLFVVQVPGLFNMCVTASFFPSEMKLAEISPIFKRNDNLCKENYRSINLLTITSKLFENIMSDQLTKYFGDLLCSTLSAYRKGYICQHVILRLMEYLRRALDNGNALGTAAMDLSRAFDKMPHALLTAKLNKCIWSVWTRLQFDHQLFA